MEDIVERLLDLLNAVAYEGALTDVEESILLEIERDYVLAKEAMCLIECPNCKTKIQF